MRGPDMNTSTISRPSVQPGRYARVEVPLSEEGPAVVRIVTKNKKADYTVNPIPTDFGFAAYRVSEIDSQAEIGHYDVLLAGECSSCDCLGFLQWGHRGPCKHIGALTALREAGRL
jgi:hypothetical protein